MINSYLLRFRFDSTMILIILTLNYMCLEHRFVSSYSEFDLTPSKFITSSFIWNISKFWISLDWFIIYLVVSLLNLMVHWGLIDHIYKPALSYTKLILPLNQLPYSHSWIHQLCLWVGGVGGRGILDVPLVFI